MPFKAFGALEITAVLWYTVDKTITREVYIINMKKILCFGDSNTYGHTPADFSRMPMPWPKVLGRLLPDCEIIEEGQCGRTTHLSTPLDPSQNGMTRFRELLRSGTDADLLILMLGTNNQLEPFECPVSETVGALKEYIRSWRAAFGSEKKILLVSPILLTEDLRRHEYFSTVYRPDAEEKSRRFAAEYEKLAKEENTYFLNAASFAATSVTDGVHMEPSEHEKLARAFAEKIREIL